jgi:hypothetical protein
MSSGNPYGEGNGEEYVSGDVRSVMSRAGGMGEDVQSTSVNGGLCSGVVVNTSIGEGNGNGSLDLNCPM